jgi:hypothetical protein
MVQGILITAIIFYSLYNIIKMFTDFLLKRKIIKAGHLDKAGILSPVPVLTEENRYPTLKWGLVSLMAGAGLILIEILSRKIIISWEDDRYSFLAVGIELVFISAGFLIYFFIVNSRKQ